MKAGAKVLTRTLRRASALSRESSVFVSFRQGVQLHSTSRYFATLAETCHKSSGSWKCAALVGGLIGASLFSLSKEKISFTKKLTDGQLVSSDVLASVAAGDLTQLVSILAEMPDLEREKAINSRHPGGWTPIHIAAIKGDPKIMSYLLDNGAEIDDADQYIYNLNTPQDILQERKLLNPKMSVTASCKGFTALHYAVILGSVDCIALLVENGADPTKQDMYGYSPQQYKTYSASGPKLAKIEQFLQKAVTQSSKLARERKKASRIKFPLEEKLRKMMVGQVMPILSVSAAMRRRDNGWVDEDKPLVLLFLGSSGVGKTMLAKAIAENVNQGKDADNRFIRIDMSEYAQKHEVARLIGSPPGYVGHEQGGQLTTRLSKCPDAVVLLDEVEKAHPDVLTVMLQVFDEGRLTDGQGNTIHCPNAVFIMTSNLLQDQIREQGDNLRPPVEASAGLSLDTESLQTSTMLKVASFTEKFLREIAQPVLKYHFKRDEFLGRINEMVIFHPFTQEDLSDIVRMELKHWAEKAEDKHGMIMRWSPEVEKALCKGYNERYGFRSIKYEVQRQVVNLLAFAHERDVISEGCELSLDVERASEDQADSVRIVIKDVKQSGNTKKRKEQDKSFWKLF